MYIPEFWAGAIATILVEIVFIVILAVVYAIKDNQSDDSEGGE